MGKSMKETDRGEGEKSKGESENVATGRIIE